MKFKITLLFILFAIAMTLVFKLDKEEILMMVILMGAYSFILFSGNKCK